MDRKSPKVEAKKLTNFLANLNRKVCEGVLGGIDERGVVA